MTTAERMRLILERTPNGTVGMSKAVQYAGRQAENRYRKGNSFICLYEDGSVLTAQRRDVCRYTIRCA